MLKLLVFPVFIGCVVVFGLIWSAYIRHTRRKRFAHRETLDLEDIFQMVPGNQILDFEQFRKHQTAIAELLSLEPGKLRPTDRFLSELAAVRLVDDEIDEVWEYISFHLEDTDPETPLTDFENLGEVMTLICRNRA